MYFFSIHCGDIFALKSITHVIIKSSKKWGGSIMKTVRKFMRFAFIFFLMFSILGLSSPQILSSSASTSANH